MTQPPTPPSYPTQPPASKNTLGLVGFIVSLVGSLGCGLGAPIGLIISLIALRRQPKGFAIAGMIIGILGSIYLVWMGMWVVSGLLDIGRTINESARTVGAAQPARDAIVAARNTSGSLPSEIEGNAIVSKHVDAWQTPFRYKLVDGAFSIISAGEDKRFDTGDDVVFSPIMLGVQPTTTTAPAGQ